MRSLGLFLVGHVSQAETQSAKGSPGTGRTVPSHAVAPPPPGWTLLKPVKKASPESILRRAPNQKGKVAVITGGNDGIGYETARVLAGAGARVIIASRNERRSAKAAAALYQGPGEGSVEALQLNLMDADSVRACAASLQALTHRIDYLILNAGVGGGPRQQTQQGFESQIGTNHFGHFLLTQCLLSRLTQQGTPVRIIALTSIAHQWGSLYLDLNDLHWRHREYDPVGGYASSKLANVLFIRTLATRLKGTNVTAFAVHPGVILTNIWKRNWTSFTTDGWVCKALGLVLAPVLKDVQQGAASVIFAAVDEDLLSRSGAYVADCEVKEPHAGALDADLGAKLWEVSEEQLAECCVGAGAGLR